MVCSILRRGASSGLLILAGLVGPGAVAAQSRPSHDAGYWSVRGLVTKATFGSVQVQTRSAVVSVTLTRSTRVTRLVTGSQADLGPGQTVEAQRVSGTNTIKSIRIDASAQSRTRGGRDHADLGARSASGRSSRQRGGTQTRLGPSGFIEGQVTRVGAGSITVRTNGHTATYPLSNNLTVTKVMGGQLSDLSFGETVEVDMTRGTTIAVAVAILSC